jgi:hypothetical protein
MHHIGKRKNEIVLSEWIRKYYNLPFESKGALAVRVLGGRYTANYVSLCVAFQGHF